MNDYSFSLISGKTTFEMPTGIVDRLCRRAVLHRLQDLQGGQVTVIDGAGSHHFGNSKESGGLQVTVHVYHPNVYRRLAFRGSVGAGESYMAGDWSCDNLTDLIRILVLNQEIMGDLEKGPVRLAMMLFKIHHALRRNTRRGSRTNIAAHYDLGNDFYQLFLDPTLMYSCAIFPRHDSTLEAASITKMDHICRKLQLTAGDHLLEIGTGWGGFAIYAAENYGCRVTTTTISRKQYELAQQRIQQASLQERVQVLLQDYRDLTGQYDKLVSIEMIEAVGHQYFDDYFSTCARLLKADGLMLLQTITIADQEYERARRSVDFIQRYIFPGGNLPSVTAITRSLTRQTDLRLTHLEDIGNHYVITLQHWRQRFLANLDRVRALGFSESFIRMWLYYLSYCEGGFAERLISDVQLLLSKPFNRRTPPLSALENQSCP